MDILWLDLCSTCVCRRKWSSTCRPRSCLALCCAGAQVETRWHRGRAVRRRHCAAGGAPDNFGRRRRGGPRPKKSAAGRRGVGGQKHFFLRFTKKFRSILKIFLGTFLVIKALRFVCK